MPNIKENAVWVDDIYLLSEETPVLGKVAGAADSGPSNLQAEQLANRTQWLRQTLDGLQAGDAPYPSPEAAQDAINAGSIPLDARFSVRVDDANIWVAEYQNVNGVATPTGKVYPSKAFVDTLSEIIRSLFTQLAPAGMSLAFMDKRKTIQPGWMMLADS